MIKVVDINGIAHDIYNIPQGTEFDNIDLSGMNFERLPDLTRIKVNGKIILRDCKFLVSLKGLPDGAKELDCHNCQALISFEGLAEGIEKLDCSSCGSLQSFKGLSDGLKIINCRDCLKIRSFEYLPDSVENIDCSACRYLAMYSLGGCTVNKFKPLPPKIKKIKCCYCDCLDTLENVPITVEEIDVNYCYRLKYIPEYFPNEKIKGLNPEMIMACKQNWLSLQQAKKDSLNAEMLKVGIFKSMER